MSDEKVVPHIGVDGIVAESDMEPYVRLIYRDEPIIQMTLSQARKIAMDILNMAARTEADAMLVRFFANLNSPPQAIIALLGEFRLYRMAHDEAHVQGIYVDPDTGEQV